MRDNSQLLLPFKGFFPHLVPALGEFPFVPGNIFFRGMERGVAGPQSQVGEEGPSGVGLLLVPDVGDGPVHQVFGQVIAGPGGGVNEMIVLHQKWGPLIGLTANKAVILLQTPYPGANDQKVPPPCRRYKAPGATCPAPWCCSRSASGSRQWWRHSWECCRSSRENPWPPP